MLSSPVLPSDAHRPVLGTLDSQETGVHHAAVQSFHGEPEQDATCSSVS